jgi:hypothetical protein
VVHVRLGVAAKFRQTRLHRAARARRIAEQEVVLVIVDGPPGIGCPVIASVTGASVVLVVTEPTVSGEHDLERVLALTRHFDIPAVVCVNKWDINPEMTQRTEDKARRAGAQVAGRIRYDRDRRRPRSASRRGGNRCTSRRGYPTNMEPFGPLEEIWNAMLISIYLRSRLDHAAPRNNGLLADFTGHARITGPCGDTMEFWLLARDRRIRRSPSSRTGVGHRTPAGAWPLPDRRQECGTGSLQSRKDV